MKIALPWSIDEEIRNYTDEYNILYVEKPNNYEDLIIFLKDKPNARFNLIIPPDFDIEKLIVLTTLYPNVYICTKYEYGIYKKYKDFNIPFYFDTSFLISTFRDLEYVANLGVTDVYIQDDLCYNLKNVRKFCDLHNLRVRLIVTQIPSHLPDRGLNIRSPWFIPEVVDELSKYIDVIEFEGPRARQWIQIKTLYEIWHKDREYRNNIQDINSDLQIEIPNQSLIPNFLIYKMNCQYKCAYGSACRKCNQFVSMAEDLYNKKIQYKFDPNEEVTWDKMVYKEEEGE